MSSPAEISYEVRAMFDPSFSDPTKGVLLSVHPTPGEATTRLAIGRLVVVANEGGTVRPLTQAEGADAFDDNQNEEDQSR